MKFDLINKVKINKNEIMKVMMFIVIALCIEIFIFNFNFFYTLIGKHEYKEIEEFENVNIIDERAYITIDALNIKTASIKLELNDEEMSKDEYKDKLEYKIQYADDTTNGYFSLNAKRYIPYISNSKYIPLFLSGKTKRVEIEINKDIYQNGYLEKIIINPTIPINFVFARFLIIFLILFYIFYLRKCEFFNANYNRKMFKQEAALLIVVYAFMILLVIINTYSSEEENYNDTENVILQQFSTEGSVYNKEFVEALKAKQYYLLEDPSEKFKSLEDPYDAHGRNDVERNVDYKWDTAYYNGHHYIYFGILPVLVFFLPYNLITGTYLKISIVTFFLSLLILVLLKEVLQKVIIRYFEDVPFKVVFLSLILLCSGSLVLYANGISRVYELVIIARVILFINGNQLYIEIT